MYINFQPRSQGLINFHSIISIYETHSRTQSPSYARCDEGLWPFSYPEPFLRAVNGARQGALAKSISNWHLIGYNEGYCSNNVYILLPCFYGIRFWIWPEPLVAPRVRRALGTRMGSGQIQNRIP